jgi:hypothetical protein
LVASEDLAGSADGWPAVSAEFRVLAVVEHDIGGPAFALIAVNLLRCESAEGFFQSEVMAFQRTGTRPRRRAMRSVAGRRAPKGGRKKRGGAPVIWARKIAGAGELLFDAGGEARARLRWVQEWLPMR